MENTCADLNLKNDDTLPVLKRLAELFNISEIVLLITYNSQKEWLVCINIPTFKGGILEANNLHLSFALGSKSSFCLSGEFNLKIGDRAMQFKTKSRFAGELILSASQLDNDLLELGAFRLSQMALSLRVGSIAMCGRIQLRKINLFGALSLSPSLGGGLTPNTLSVAISDITLKELVESILGIDISGDSCLNEIAVQGVKIPAEKRDGTPEEIEKNLADWGNRLREMVEGVGNIDKGTEHDFVYTLGEDNRISIMDKTYMRHYSLIPEGDAYIPQIEAQFIIAKISVELGIYIIPRGAFVCANICILGVQAIAFLKITGFDIDFNIKIDVGIRYCTMLSPIKRSGLLEITGTGRSIENNSLATPSPPAIIQSIMDLSHQKQGAICYFSADKKQGVNLYLDAHINLLAVIVFDANIQMSKGIVKIDTSGCLLRVFKYVLSIKCTYSDFDNASFSALLAIDSSTLKGKFKRIQRKIETAKSSVTNKKDKIEKKFELAQMEVDRLHHQIISFNSQIAKIKHDSSGLSFFKSITSAVQILGLEMAKTAIVSTMAIVYAALKIAKTVVDAPFAVTHLALDMVNIILEGTMELFYIERFLITATLGKDSGFLFDLDFVLFGKHLNVEHRVASLSGVQGDQLLNELDEKMFKISELDSKEMPPFLLSLEHSDKLDFNLENLLESLEAGRISVDSAYHIIQNAEALYVKHIDSEMDFVEKEELKASFIQNSHMIKEYTQLSENMNNSALQALQLLDIPEGEDDLQYLLKEKKNLLSMLQNIEKQNGLLKETLDDTTKNIEISRTIVKKDYGEREVIDADWNDFAKEMEEMLVYEANKSIGNHYIVAGYESSIIQSIRDYSEFVRKSDIKIPEGYTSRMEN